MLNINTGLKTLYNYHGNCLPIITTFIDLNGFVVVTVMLLSTGYHKGYTPVRPWNQFFLT